MKVTSRASDYALLLLIYLAKLPPDEKISVKKIAEHHNLSLKFLASIANKLAISRLISSHRGVGGGIKLGRPGNLISVRDVLEAVDGPVQTMFCQNTHELCNHEDLCQMKNFWDKLQNNVIEKLSTTMINDLISQKNLNTEKKPEEKDFSKRIEDGAFTV